MSSKSTTTIRNAAYFGGCGFNSARDNSSITKNTPNTLQLTNKQTAVHQPGHRPEDDLNISCYKTARTESQPVPDGQNTPADHDFANSASASVSVHSSTKRQNINEFTARAYELKKQNYFTQKEKE